MVDELRRATMQAARGLRRSPTIVLRRATMQAARGLRRSPTIQLGTRGSPSVTSAWRPGTTVALV
jgi:hypothetical protein